jgi:hypothetical protein
VKIWATGYSTNKGPLSCAKLKLLWVVYLLSLAGRGGEGDGEMRLFKELWLGDSGEHLLHLRVSMLSFLEFFSRGPKPAATSALPLHIMVKRRSSSTSLRWSIFLQASSRRGGSSAPAAGYYSVVLAQMVRPRCWYSWHGGGAQLTVVEKELEDPITFYFSVLRALL